MRKYIIFCIPILLSFQSFSQNLTYNDLCVLLKKNSLTVVDVTLSQNGYYMNSNFDKFNYNWRVNKSSEWVHIWFLDNKPNDITYYTENPNSVSKIINDIESEKLLKIYKPNQNFDNDNFTTYYKNISNKPNIVNTVKIEKILNKFDKTFGWEISLSKYFIL